MFKFIKMLFAPKCKHRFPEFLKGVHLEGHFPYNTATIPYKECLYCGKRVPMTTRSQPNDQ